MKFIKDKGSNLFQRDALIDQSDNVVQRSYSTKYTYH